MVVVAGEAITVAPVVVFKPVAGDQVYEILSGVNLKAFGIPVQDMVLFLPVATEATVPVLFSMPCALKSDAWALVQEVV